MRTLQISVLLATAFALPACTSIPNAREADVLINGNCEECEATIEQAALQDGVCEANWDRETRHATITYDSTKITLPAILQRIAGAGYDNQDFIAPDSAYDQLPECCQYTRTGKTVAPPRPEDTRHGH